MWAERWGDGLLESVQRLRACSQLQLACEALNRLMSFCNHGEQFNFSLWSWSCNMFYSFFPVKGNNLFQKKKKHPCGLIWLICEVIFVYLQTKQLTIPKSWSVIHTFKENYPHPLNISTFSTKQKALMHFIRILSNGKTQSGVYLSSWKKIMHSFPYNIHFYAALFTLLQLKKTKLNQLSWDVI